MAPSPSAAAPSTALGRIRALIEKLRRGEAGPREIAALREELLKGNPQESIAAILEFLRTGDDASTGLGFEIGAGGKLSFLSSIAGPIDHFRL